MPLKLKAAALTLAFGLGFVLFYVVAIGISVVVTVSVVYGPIFLADYLFPNVGANVMLVVYMVALLGSIGKFLVWDGFVKPFYDDMLDDLRRENE